MRIDIWTDTVCPFCYLGVRRMELALERFEHRDEVELVWHGFQLDPSMPAVATQPLAEMLSEKFGVPVEQSEATQRQVAAQAAEIGLDFGWQDAKYGNTLDAHRLVQLAQDHDLGTVAEKRLMRAYFAEGVQIGDTAELQRLGEEIGLDADEVRELLAGDRFADRVHTDQRTAQQLGANGVPFFVLGERLGLSGAQPEEVVLDALRQAWDAA